jgi:serine/threonine-protein kinase
VIEPAPSQSGSLSATLARRVDQACNRFERAWQSGAPPQIEDFLSASSDAEHTALLHELILLDIDYRRQHGQEPQPHDYASRFPHLPPDWLEQACSSNQPTVDSAPTLERPTPPPADLRGLRLGDYELQEEIARGAMGVVYKARQNSLARTVAIKMILAGRLASSEEVQRFRAEAESAAALDHPNIVPIYEVNSHDSLPYFSMKLIDGGHLGRHVQRFLGDPRAAAQLVRTAALAVHHAHQHGILHRDLKPTNILLDSQGQPHLTDFGLAKRLEAGQAGQTQSGVIVGTPGYMAPEQASGHNRALTTAADVYALGAILYELLTGRPPFVGATVLETMQQVVSAEPVPPSRRAAGVPRDLEVICLKCLHKEPSRRYGSAAALAEELRRYLDGEAIEARAVGRLERGVKWLRRHPMAAALLVTLLLGSGISSYFAIIAHHRAQVADQAAEKASAKERETEAALRQLEETTAASLLRPIGQRPDLIEPVEVQALEELAALDNDRVRQIFLERGLSKPEQAQRLAARAGPVAIALVGLDHARRERVGRLLTEHLRDSQTPAPVRRACVLLGRELGWKEPDFVRDGVAVLVAALAGPTELGELQELEPVLSALLRDSQAEQSGRHAQILLDGIRKAIQPFAMRLLATQLRFVLDKLDAAEAASYADEAARILLARLVKSANEWEHEWLAYAMKEVADKMTAGRVPAYVRDVLAWMGQATSPRGLRPLAEMMAKLSAQLTPEQARAAADEVIGILLARTDKASEALLEHLVLGTVLLAGSLSDEQLHKHAQTLLEQMDKKTNYDDLQRMAKPFAGVLKNRGHQADRYTALLLDHMRKTPNPQTLRPVAEMLRHVSSILPRGASTRHARAILLRMDQGSPSWSLPSYAIALMGVLWNMGAASAAPFADEAADLLLNRLGKLGNASDLEFHAYALKEVAPRLSATRASEYARLVVARLHSITSPPAINPLGSMLRGLLVQLKASEARRLADETAELLLAGLAKAPRPFDVQHFTLPLMELSGQLSPQMVRTCFRRILDRIQATTDPLALVRLRECLEATWNHLDQSEAVRLADETVGVFVARLIQNNPQPVRFAFLSILHKVSQRPPLSGSQGRRHALVLLNHLNDQTEVDVRLSSFQAVKSLLSDRRPEEIRQNARFLLDRMKKQASTNLCSGFADVLNEILNSLDAADAALFADEAADFFFDRLARIAYPYERVSLSEALKSLTSKVSAARAANYAPGIVAQMRDSTYLHSLTMLTESLANLAGKLPADQARRVQTEAADLLIVWVSRLPRAEDAFPLAQCAWRISGGLDAQTRQRLAARMIHIMLPEMRQAAFSSSTLEGIMSYRTATFQHVVSASDLAGLAQVLKAPLCMGMARSLILAELGRRCNHTFATVWDFADWAHQHKPELDLRPPRRRGDE